MESFIKKIFEGKHDEQVHLQFVKFSRGEFKDRALVNISKSTDKYSISAGAEYANELVRNVASLIPSGKKVSVSGAIITTVNLKEDSSFTNVVKDFSVSQFQGVKKYSFTEDLDKNNIIAICDKFPKAFIALSFNAGDAGNTELKIKPKAPKSAKPKNKEEEPKADFCKLKTSNKSLVELFSFDLGDFKKADIKHDFIITDIEIPKNETDPARMRELAIRKGKIVRYLKIDGNDKKNQIEFKA